MPNDHPAGTDDFAWAVEEACRNAWPSHRQLVFDDWVLCASGGPSRRSNCVHPLRQGPRDPDGIVGPAEDIYGRLGQSSLFRILSIAPELDGVLDARGYASEGGTATLHADLTRRSPDRVGPVELSPVPGPDWLAARAAATDASSADQIIYRKTVETLLLPAAFASCRENGTVAAVAYGAIHAGLLVLESVVTHPAHRRRGLGLRVVAGLMDWGRWRGAAGACLQVVSDNGPARALYHSVGFRTEVYRYHYRRKDRVGRGDVTP